MNALDRDTFALMWATSSAEGLSRYKREIERNAPPYDARPPLIEPRDHVARCANPRCGFPIIVRAHKGPERRYCDNACLQSASYWRNPEPQKARSRARLRARRGSLVDVERACEQCGAPHAKRWGTRFCSDLCRTTYWNAQRHPARDRIEQSSRRTEAA